MLHWRWLVQFQGKYFLYFNQSFPFALRTVERKVFQNGIFSNFVTGFAATDRTAYPFCLLFHKHSDINFSSIGLSCLALRIGKSWFAPCNVIARQFEFWASNAREVFMFWRFISFWRTRFGRGSLFLFFNGSGKNVEKWINFAPEKSGYQERIFNRTVETLFS